MGLSAGLGVRSEQSDVVVWWGCAGKWSGVGGVRSLNVVGVWVWRGWVLAMDVMFGWVLFLSHFARRVVYGLMVSSVQDCQR